MSRLIVDVQADWARWEVRKRGSGTANAHPRRYDEGGPSATGSGSSRGWWSPSHDWPARARNRKAPLSPS